jgi:Ca2+-binding RTX toxin-like protein
MATFTGNSAANVLSAAAGTLNGFSGGTLAELQDFVGDLIQGEDGNDVITAGRGADTIFGGSGNDTLRGGSSPSLQTDNLFGGDGNDQMFGDGTYMNLYGGAGNDTLHSNHIFGENEGGAGADRIIGTGSVIASSLSYRGSGTGVVVNLQTNTASGGDAQGDVISDFRSVIGSAFGDRLTAGAGNGVLQGLAGNDTLIGGAGDDKLVGGDNDDTLTGGAGNDTLDGGLGADRMDGGDGLDEVSYESQSTGITINLATQAGGGGAAGDRLISIEDLTGSNGDDSLLGSRRAEQINGSFGHDLVSGLEGDDDLSGGYGNDTVLGGAGNDTLSGSVGNDSIDGGDGFDILRDGSTSYAATIDIGAGTWVTNGETDRFANVESFVTSSGNDSLSSNGSGHTLDGGFGDDSLFGGGGNDVLVASSGADWMDGGTGRDTLFLSFAFEAFTFNLQTGKGDHDDLAGDQVRGIENLAIGTSFRDATIIGSAAANVIDTDSGNDSITGGKGDDTIDSGSGNDRLSGGKGADTFVFSQEFLTAGSDRITDFGRGDSFDLSRDTFDALGRSVSGSELRFGRAARDGNDHLIYNEAKGQLFYDADGRGGLAADLIAVLTNRPDLSASDFDMI